MICRLRLVSLMFACLISAAVSSSQGLADSGGASLYRIELASDQDARIVENSGVKALLRSDNNYLVTGASNAIEYLTKAGIVCDRVRDDFSREEWVILVHDNPSVKMEQLSLGLSSEDWIEFEGSLIVRRRHAENLVSARNGLMSVEIPRFDVPIKFIRPQIPGPVVPPSEMIDSLLSLISMDSLEAYVRRLESFVTRYTYSDSIIAARDWIIEKFGQFGLEAEIDSFETSLQLPYGDYAYNVVADHTGTTAPDILIIICGHYDSILNFADPYLVAPGADDNASGTALCLELARVLQSFDTPKTVRFICFTAEEQGLVGANAYVVNHPGLNIEVVINADMIAYTGGYSEEVIVYRDLQTTAHAQYVSELVARYTLLTPMNPGNSERSDHAPFQQAGYPAMFLHEAVPTNPHYHRSTDLADYLDFEYMTEIVKGCAAATLSIAEAPPVVTGLTVSDPGKGDRLLLEWEEAADSRAFRYEIEMDTTPVILFPTAYSVPKGTTSLLIDGLSDGQVYYVSAKTIIDDTLESILSSQASGIPMAMPYPATAVTAKPLFSSIELTWEQSIHPDVVGYKIFRSASGMNSFTNVATVDDTAWTDFKIEGDYYYDYFLVAVDEDSNESVSPDTVSSRGAFFNKDLLVVVVPPEIVDADVPAAKARYRYMLSDVRYDYLEIEDEVVPIEELGQYRSVIWINDGASRVMSNSPSLEWVIGYGTDLFLTVPMPASPGEGDVSERFALRDAHWSQNSDFVYADGAGDWPDALVDTTVRSNYSREGSGPYLQYVQYYDHDPEVSTAVYRFQSTNEMGESHNQPCGLYSELDTVKMVLFGFPLFHVDAESGRSIMNHVADLFGIPRVLAGDVNDDSTYTLIDCTAMLRILYWDYPFPEDSNRLDVNNDCVFDLTDILYLVAYIYMGGPDPTYGCIETD